MNRYQNISEFLDFLPGHERIITEELRDIILQCIPGVKEKLSYGVPYYYGKKRICFIWPSSIPWGHVQKNGVLLGFCYGNLLDDELDYLEKENRKQVYMKTFLNKDEINDGLVRKYLYKAAEVDRNF